MSSPPHLIGIPGDPSQAAFWLVGACLAPGSDLTVENVYLGPARGGFVDVLARMGADISVDPGSGDIRARSSELRATRVTADELPGCIDEVPILAVAAAAADGVTVFEGIDELRVKESDRVTAIAEMLAALGVGCRFDSQITLAVLAGGRLEPERLGRRDRCLTWETTAWPWLRPSPVPWVSESVTVEGIRSHRHQLSGLCPQPPAGHRMDAVRTASGERARR